MTYNNNDNNKKIMEKICLATDDSDIKRKYHKGRRDQSLRQFPRMMQTYEKDK